MGRLDRKVAIVSGGAGLIGGAAARLFVAEGARVVLVDREADAVSEAARRLGDATSPVVAVVTRPEDCERMVRATVERHGGVDVLLLNAGVEGVVQPIPSYPLDAFEQVMAVNVRGVFLGLKYGMPALQARGGGSVVITSSIAGLHGFAGAAAYVTSKHAVVGLMRVAALEGAPHGVRVNTVNPAPIEGRMIRSLEEGLSPGAPEQARQQLAATIPLGRYGVEDEVARLMLFLASDESRYCTGGVYSVDGGMSAV
jgi:NAD(P)-dependent dehydrogenase (short-subunit alcohol dehydrogenase family)